MTDRRPVSRWRSSETTFGPLGRVLATVLLVVPILFAIFVNLFFLVAALLWAFVAIPALRDVWRHARYGEAPPQPVIRADAPPLVPGESIADRKAPTRW